MEQLEFTRSERFLKLYRVLEGLLDKRYSGRREGSSVVMEYLRDDDSEPYRQQLDLCREIRNLLTHTSDERGEPVVEPSESVLKALEAIIRHVSMPRYAVDFGTPAERILCASPNDSALDVMRRMRKMGFSHGKGEDGRRVQRRKPLQLSGKERAGRAEAGRPHRQAQGRTAGGEARLGEISVHARKRDGFAGARGV